MPSRQWSTDSPQRVAELESLLNRVTRERDSFRDQLAGLTRRVGAATEKERQTPLVACLDFLRREL
jgi:hypothetical protein